MMKKFSVKMKFWWIFVCVLVTLAQKRAADKLETSTVENVSYSSMGSELRKLVEPTISPKETGSHTSNSAESRNPLEKTDRSDHHMPGHSYVQVISKKQFPQAIDPPSAESQRMHATTPRGQIPFLPERRVNSNFTIGSISEETTRITAEPGEKEESMTKSDSLIDFGNGSGFERNGNRTEFRAENDFNLDSGNGSFDLGMEPNTTMSEVDEVSGVDNQSLVENTQDHSESTENDNGNQDDGPSTEAYQGDDDQPKSQDGESFSTEHVNVEGTEEEVGSRENELPQLEGKLLKDKEPERETKFQESERPDQDASLQLNEQDGQESGAVINEPVQKTRIVVNEEPAQEANLQDNRSAQTVNFHNDKQTDQELGILGNKPVQTTEFEKGEHFDGQKENIQKNKPPSQEIGDADGKPVQTKEFDGNERPGKWSSLQKNRVVGYHKNGLSLKETRPSNNGMQKLFPIYQGNELPRKEAKPGIAEQLTREVDLLREKPLARNEPLKNALSHVTSGEKIASRDETTESSSKEEPPTEPDPIEELENVMDTESEYSRDQIDDKNNGAFDVRKNVSGKQDSDEEDTNDSLPASWPTILTTSLDYTTTEGQNTTTVTAGDVVRDNGTSPPRARTSLHNFAASPPAKPEMASIRELPFLAISVTRLNHEKYIRCTATIISEWYVLSTAHCYYDRGDVVIPSRVTIVTAQTQSDINKLDAHAQLRIADVVSIYPGYGPLHFDSMIKDLAVIKVRKAFEISEHCKPISLRTTPVSPTENLSCFAPGWAISDSKNELFSPNQLARMNLSIGLGTRCPCLHWMQTKGFMCPVREADYSICNGDFGGPLVCGDKLVGVAQGLVSANCSEPIRLNEEACGLDKVSIYIYLCPYLGWLSGYVKELRDLDDFPCADPDSALSQTGHSLAVVLLLLTVLSLK